ncbi:MAG: glycosyltransferase family 4 protein [Candidatus Neomarinimicrobiota bacterium]
MDKKLTIFFSNSISAPKWGGGEKWMVTAARGLNDRGHRIILSGKDNSIFIQQAKFANLRTIPLNIRADYSPLKIFNTKKILKREKVDVIVLNLNKDIRVAGIAAKLAGVPVIIARNGIQLIADKWKHKKTMNIVDGIITNSKSIERVYNSYKWMPAGKTRVIYNGIEMNGEINPVDLRIIWNIPEVHTVFLAAGRLTGQKGFDLLIDAVSRIDLNKYPCTVLIAGRGKHRRRLEQKIKANNLEKFIKLIGFQQNLPTIIVSADFVIMPSRQEGMPNIIMESMALGKPVLAANVNGVPELVDHNKTGYIFEPFNVKTITETMLWAIENRESDQIKKWGPRARKVVRENFSMERMLDNLEAYFFELYGRTNR